MRMASSEYDLNYLFEENKATEFLIDTPEKYQEIINKLLAQLKGEDDSIVFSENDKEVRLDKNADIILSPFQIDINNRKILAKIYQEAIKEQQDTNTELMQQLHSYMERFVIEICEHSDYSLTYDSNPEVIDVLKMFNVHIDDNEINLAEKIVSYIKLSHRVLNITLFIFAGLRAYFTDDVLEQLLQTLSYEKVSVLLLERYDSKLLVHENRIILDKDACIIYPDE